PGLALEGWERAAVRQGDVLDRPENRNGPENGVPFRVAQAVDLALGVDFQMRGGNHLRRQRKDLGTGQNNAVKIHLDPPLAHEMSGILIILEVATQFRASGKYRMPEGRHVAKIAKHRIAD